MPKASNPGLNLFLNILVKLEELEIPYAIIGGFAATIYGITRATYDIDIVVDMEESHIQALARSYPLPRYYADPEQMRRSTELGSTFNIIDTTLGEKADLFPLTMDLRYQPAFDRRIRRAVDIPEQEAFSVWAARPEDVIIGKMMAWQDGRSNRHPADIYEMMLFHYMGGDADLAFDFEYISSRLAELGSEVADLWTLLNTTASEESSRS